MEIKTGKKTPQERWSAHIRERVTAFRYSKEFRRLRRRGLAVLGRTMLLDAVEYWRGWSEWLSHTEFMRWREECQSAGENFGLAQWTVEMMCLLRNYRPERSSLVAEVHWPQITVVTEVEDTLFQKLLGYWSWILGYKVVFKKGPVETVLIWLNDEKSLMEKLPLSSLPPQQTAIWTRVETPAVFPPEAGAKLEKEAAELKRTLLEKLGYKGVPKRLRSSSLVEKAGILKASTGKLPPRGLYEIATEIFEEATETKDRKLVKNLKTQRHRVRKRLGLQANESSG